jgi:hypothetical protein
VMIFQNTGEHAEKPIHKNLCESLSIYEPWQTGDRDVSIFGQPHYEGTNGCKKGCRDTTIIATPVHPQSSWMIAKLACWSPVPHQLEWGFLMMSCWEAEPRSTRARKHQSWHPDVSWTFITGSVTLGARVLKNMSHVTLVLEQ